MRTEKPSVELLISCDPYEHVAKCARICYAANKNNNTDDKTFVLNLVKERGHKSILRHASYYYKIPLIGDVIKNKKILALTRNKYIVAFTDDLKTCYMSVNGQSLYDSGLTPEEMKEWEIPAEEFPAKEYLRFTFKVRTQISTSREFNRTSPNNICERSTRYCNFTKDKFGNEITICEPYWFVDAPEEVKNDAIRDWEEDEKHYIERVNDGWAAEAAREFLPIATLTEVAYTYTVEEWRAILDLRYYGLTGRPHPNAKIIATKIREELIKLNYDFV